MNRDENLVIGIALFLILTSPVSILIFLGLTDKSDLGKTDNGETPFHGVENINRVANSIKINNYFIRNNKYWRVCDVYGERIENKEEGYIDHRLKRVGRLIKIQSGHGYKHRIREVDGEYKMEVDMTCEFNAIYQTSVFGHASERLEFDGGTIHFDVDIEERDEKYRLNSMKAYKHTGIDDL